ncbi:MAG: hydrolase TatD, partial [Bacteroidota bacterium]
MLERGVPTEHVALTTYGNALAVYGQSGQFNEEDWADTPEIDRSELFSDNSIRRGGNGGKNLADNIVKN